VHRVTSCARVRMPHRVNLGLKAKLNEASPCRGKIRKAIGSDQPGQILKIKILESRDPIDATAP
jgi:hypothetical protein